MDSSVYGNINIQIFLRGLGLYPKMLVDTKFTSGIAIMQH